MALDDLRGLYEEFDSEQVKKSLDLGLVEMKAYGQDGNIQSLINKYFILYDVAEKMNLLGKTELKEYKIKYFDAIRKTVKDWESKK